jgi:hypothetical protein
VPNNLGDYTGNTQSTVIVGGEEVEVTVLSDYEEENLQIQERQLWLPPRLPSSEFIDEH